MDIPQLQSYCQTPNPANNRTSFRVFQIVEIQLFEKQKVHSTKKRLLLLHPFVAAHVFCIGTRCSHRVRPSRSKACTKLLQNNVR